MMKFIVEVEDANLKSQIEAELYLFEKIFTGINIFKDLKVSSIFVPLNFDQQVNKLNNINNYNSKRGTFTAMARIAEHDGAIAIVLSLDLFADLYDLRTRLYVLFHESTHIWNKEHIIYIETDSKTKTYYLHQLTALYDEYYADRMSCDITDVFEATEKWAGFVRQVVFGFLNLTITSEYHDLIQLEIDSFRQHGSVDLFAKKTEGIAEGIMILSVHAFAFFHQYPLIVDDIPSFTDMYFTNEKTLALMNYLKNKFESDASDLEDGIPLIVDYMKNFGVFFEDTQDGMYCYVVDL